MELQYFVYPEDLAAAQEDFNVTDNMMEFFATVFGEYPFLNEKYGMAEFPWGGAMEHQTITSYGDPLIRGDHYYDYINAHELAHQWFGDCITMRSWSHIWLNEGFASYSEALWEESLGGSSAYHAYLDTQDPGSFQGSLFVVDSTNANALFSNTVYDKGSWTLHMLRGVLGDSLFFNCLNGYATDPNIVYATAITEDFRDLCESVSGQDLHWFFEQWVYRPGRPNYVYNWETTGTAPPYQTTLNLLQTNTELYKMPLQIHLFGNGLDTLFTVWDSLNEQQFQFMTNIEPMALEVDPDNWVLKNIIEGDIYTVSGQVIDIGDSSGVADAEVYWSGPYDPFSGSALAIQIDTTDINGNFQFQVVNGDFGIQAYRPDYLVSKFYFHSVNSDSSGIILTLSQPQAVYYLDSLNFTLDNNQVIDTLFTVLNTGTGEMAIQVVEGNFTSKSNNLVKTPLLYSQFPVSDLLKASPAMTNKIADPVDSLWLQIHHDIQELPSNAYDLADTYVQGDDNTGYIKLTTHVQPATFNNLRINIIIDTDNNSSTGAPGYGAEYLIAVGEFGGGFYGYLLFWSDASQNFEFVGPVDYFASSLTNKYIETGMNWANIGNPNIVRLFIDAYDITNLIQTRDFVPASNLGYLVTPPLTDISWLEINPHFGSITVQDTVAEFVLTIDPSDLGSGFHAAGITIYSSHADEMERVYIPIYLDYTTGITDNKPVIPTHFDVSQNYPNPFNPSTRINIALPQSGTVTAEIFNILGQKVYSKVQTLPAGYHTFIWDSRNMEGRAMPTGIYFYRIAIHSDRISDGKNSALRKMVLLR